MAHWGACTNLTAAAACGTMSCPVNEDPSLDVPVCGSNGNVYR